MPHFTMISKLFTIVIVSTISVTLYADGNEESMFKHWGETRNKGVSTVKFQQYTDLCGSCHFAYQPGLLPALSWEKIISNPGDHFGQKITMTNSETRTMWRYLLDNSAGHVNDDISHKILQTLKYNPIPVRITKTPYFLSRHELVTQQEHNNTNIETIGQCDYCHQDARQGAYDKQKIQFSKQYQRQSNITELKM